MQKINVSDDIMAEFKEFVLKKHGKLYGGMCEEAGLALKNHMKKLYVIAKDDKGVTCMPVVSENELVLDCTEPVSVDLEFDEHNVIIAGRINGKLANITNINIERHPQSRFRGSQA